MKKELIIFVSLVLLAVPLLSAEGIGKIGDSCSGYNSCQPTYFTDHGKFYSYCGGNVCMPADGIDGHDTFLDWCGDVFDTGQSAPIIFQFYGIDASIPCGQQAVQTSSDIGDFRGDYDYRHRLVEVSEAETGSRLRATLYDHFGGGAYASWTPESGWIQSKTNPSGSVLWSKDAGGHELFNTYDSLDRLTRSRYYNADDGALDYWVDYCYDTTCTTQESCFSDGASSFNLLCEVRDSNGNIVYSYDKLGRVTERTATMYDDVQGPQSYTFSYVYRDDGSIDYTVYPDGSILDYEYTLLGQLLKVTYDGEPIGEFTYTPFGGVAEKILNPAGPLNEKIYASFAYDDKNQLASLYYSFSAPYAQNEIFARGMTYDAVGNVLGISSDVSLANPSLYQGASEIETYTYDGLYRLLGADYHGSGLYGYTYENLLGDRATKTVNGVVTAYDYDSLRRLESTTGSEAATFGYDPNGNMITHEDVVGGISKGYTFDSLNRMTRAVVDGVETRFMYDSQNQRVKKTTPEETKFYVYDGGKVVMEEVVFSHECVAACGDVTGDEIINLADVNALINYIWGAGQAPVICAANVDGSVDGLVDYYDAVALYEALRANTQPNLCTPTARLSDQPTQGKTLEDLRVALEPAGA